MSRFSHSDGTVTLMQGDCLEVLPELDDESVDSIVTDPPYELGFMGRAWDASGIAYNVDLWKQCLRVLKPGGHLLAFGGTRTYHRLTCAIEDAGFEIRDEIAWLYGSGFPKSLDVSKAIDRTRDDGAAIRRVTAWFAAQRKRSGVTFDRIDAEFGMVRMASHWATQGAAACVPTWDQWLRLRELIGLGGEMDAEVWRLNGRKGTPGEAWADREVVGTGYRVRRESDVQIVGLSDGEYPITAPATGDAARWSGWGTALKPAHEPIVVARKPLGGTVAANVLQHGTGALNIDGCRVEHDGTGVWGNSQNPDRHAIALGYMGGEVGRVSSRHDAGRWPANVVLDEYAAAELDQQSGIRPGFASQTSRADSKRKTDGSSAYGAGIGPSAGYREGYDDTGGASRFFPVFRYQAKAPTKERPKVNGTAHPTVKPLALMQWLVRLVTPPGGLVLDPFAGSGTTAAACVAEGFRCITIERHWPYIPLIIQRIFT